MRRVSMEGLPAFTRQTYELLRAYEAEMRLSENDPEGSAVLLACDFLVETLGQSASWERFDVRTFGAFLRERVPPFAQLLPGLVVALASFFCFLTARGVVSERRASAVVAAMYQTVPASRRVA